MVFSICLDLTNIKPTKIYLYFVFKYMVKICPSFKLHPYKYIKKRLSTLEALLKKNRNSLKFYQNYRNCGPRNIHSSKSWIYIKIHLYKTTSKSNYI